MKLSQLRFELAQLDMYFTNRVSNMPGPAPDPDIQIIGGRFMGEGEAVATPLRSVEISMATDENPRITLVSR